MAPKVQADKKKLAKSASSKKDHVKITAADIGLLVSVLPPRDDNGEQDIVLATELATDLLLHFQYVRLLIYDVVDKNPFHVLQPRHAWTEKGSCIARTMHFQKYLRGLVETIKEGSVVQRGLLLGEVYARKFEDYITWPEFECVLAHGHTLSQNLIQVIQADFNRRAEAARDETASVVLPGQAYEPMIRMVDFQELLTTYEIGLDLKIDVKGMIKDIRNSMFLASS